MLTTSTATVASSRLAQHFWGSEPRCVSPVPIPIVLVADLTLTGEIDDSISVFLYRQLERMGCVRLLADGHLATDRIARVLAIGGRLHGERFGQAAGLLGRFGSFTDFNVRKDAMATDYLVRHVPEKLVLYTYRNGVGARMVSANMVAEAIPALTGHADKRERWLRRMLGYTAIPSWDTWTTSYFIAGRMHALGCGWTSARLRSEPGLRWPQLWLTRSSRNRAAVLACHPVLLDGGPVPGPR